MQHITAHYSILTVDSKFRYSRFPGYKHENPAYWHHIATTWSSGTGHWKIYLDGSLVSVVHDSASGITIPAGGPLYIGKDIFFKASLKQGEFMSALLTANQSRRAANLK